jgi:shikimate kinase
MATQSSADGSLRAGADGTSITLIGPGAAGKSTVGALLAERLGIPFVDLDRCFEARAGDISRYINRFGYGAYARKNVETCHSLSHEGRSQYVAALSSGFMTYPRSIHPQYAHLRRCIEESPTTFVLIPSFMCDVCIAETVRRQLARPFAGSREKEEAVIRERFPIHVGLRARKIETMHPLTVIVEELLVAIRGLTSSSGFRRTLGASVLAAGSRTQAWPSSDCEQPA